MIPYFNISPNSRERELLLDAFDSGWWSGGEYVTKFEDKLASIYNRKCLSVSNGTTSLMLAFMAMNLVPGDEVILPGFGFMAAANVAVRMGLTPVFVDVRSDTWNLDATLVEQSITNRTKAIVAIHTYGVLCSRLYLSFLAGKYHLWFVEDCAESFGSYDGAKILAGSVGHIGTFSFQATKTVTTGEGGAVITSNDNLYNSMRLIREHGLNKRGTYSHVEYGLNFRLPNLLAAIGVAQLENYQAKIARRNAIAEYYRNNLPVQSQDCPEGTAVWVFAFRTGKRDDLITQLKQNGIEPRPGFLSPYYLEIHSKPYLPVANLLSQEVISLPTYPELTDGEVEYICSTTKRLL